MRIPERLRAEAAVRKIEDGVADEKQLPRWTSYEVWHLDGYLARLLDSLPEPAAASDDGEEG